MACSRLVQAIPYHAFKLNLKGASEFETTTVQGKQPSAAPTQVLADSHSSTPEHGISKVVEVVL